MYNRIRTEIYVKNDAESNVSFEQARHLAEAEQMVGGILTPKGATLVVDRLTILHDAHSREASNLQHAIQRLGHIDRPVKKA